MILHEVWIGNMTTPFGMGKLSRNFGIRDQIHSGNLT